MPTINPSSGGTTRKDRLHEGKAEATDTHDGIDLSIVAQLDARILFREVSRRQYRLFWILVLCLRAGCAVFLYITTRIYFFVSDPRMSYYAALVTPAGGPQLKLFGAAFATLAAVHCIDILKMLLCSLYSRDLAFEWPEDGMSKLELTQMRLTSVLFSRVASSGARITRAQWIQRVVVCFNRVGRSVVRTIKWLRIGLFHRTGIFGVESGYFHWRFLLREVSEIICQSIQVFSASQIVPSRTINRLLLGAVVCNCLSTPVIQFCCQRLRTQNKVILSVVSRTRRISVQPQATAEARPSVDIHNSSQRSRFFDSLVLERFLCVTIDLALDMCSSLAVPVVLFAPYYTDFDMDDLSFGADRLYDDVWFVTMVRTVQQVGVVSWFDLVLTWFPHYSIHASLHVLVGLIQPIGLVKSFSKSPSQALVDTSMKDLAMTTDMLLSANRPSLQKQRRRRQFARSETRGIKWLWMIQSSIVIWGLLLLASFIFSGYVQDAMSIPDDNEWGTYCQMHVRPWFAQKLACSVLYLDCFQLVRRHNGDSSRMNDAINSVLDNIEHSTLAVVIFAHCPALQMPPQLQHFHNLLGVEVFNSTIMEWSAGAGLTQEHHPRIIYVIISRSNFTSFPEGIHGPLPKSLCDIEISTTNLTQLPFDLHQRWKDVTTFYLEYSNIATLPPTLTMFHTDDLSLIGNKLTSLDSPLWDSNRFHCAQLVTLSLGYNPLQSLPIHGFCDMSTLSELAIEGTSIVTLPSWVKSVDGQVFAFKTPFCDSLINSVEEKYHQDGLISCVDSNRQAQGRFPLRLVTSRRQISSS